MFKREDNYISNEFLTAEEKAQIDADTVSFMDQVIADLKKVAKAINPVDGIRQFVDDVKFLAEKFMGKRKGNTD